MEKPMISVKEEDLKRKYWFKKKLTILQFFCFFFCDISKTKTDDLGPFAVEGHISRKIWV